MAADQTDMRSAVKVGLIVPTLNPGDGFRVWIDAYERQALKADEVLVIDSGSSDQTIDLADRAGFRTVTIEASQFDHGGTRQLAADQLSDCDVLTYCTQDAVLADSDSLKNLVAPFYDPDVAAVCGRQLPRADADPFAAHARLFNYPEETVVKTMSDVHRYGIKTPFMSNSFAAYRRTHMDKAGGFPKKNLFAEDMYLAGRMLLNGFKIVYSGSACVYHSHNYPIIQEFKRYFDIGAFHAMQPWIRERFGGGGNEGFSFLKSECRHLLRTAPWRLIQTPFRTAAKLFGFRLGLLHESLPVSMRQACSMHRSFWNRPESAEEVEKEKARS